MSACIVLSERQRWEVQNWMFHQFYYDLRTAYPDDQGIRAYLEQLEPILFDDFRNNGEDEWVARLYYSAAKGIIEGRFATQLNDEGLRPIYLAALRDLVELFEVDGRFVREQ
jgi:hypothetical protein